MGQKGGALFVLLAVIGIAVLLLVGALTRKAQQLASDQQTANVLAQAKDVLIGYAASPTASSQRPGDLIRPDSFSESPANYDGHADGGCLDSTTANGLPLISSAGNPNMRCLGRLPWVDLGMSIPSADENDPAGLMPWYAVSANLVDTACLDILNSDTVTLPPPPVNADATHSYTAPQPCAIFPALPGTLPHPWLTVRDANGNVISNRVAAVIIIPGPVLAGQLRPPSPSLAGASQYLDSITVPAGCSAPCIPGTYSNADMDNDFIASNPTSTFNDRILFITIDELMTAVAKRVAGDAGNALKTFYKTCGFYPRPVNFAIGSCYTGTTCASDASQLQGRFPYSAKPAGTAVDWTLPSWFLGNRWDAVLYYAVSSSYISGGTGSILLTVDGSAVARSLFFTPATNPTFNRVAAPTTLGNYLLTTENANTDTIFVFRNTNENGYMRTSDTSPSYSPSNPNPACTTSSTTHVTFANPSDFAKFATAIAGAGVTVDSATQTMSIEVAGGSRGGCAWFPEAIQLNGKTLRAYYTFTFINPDPSGGVDLGYGFTFSLLEGDAGVPTSATCGSQSAMGVVPASMLPFSLFLETDVYNKSSDNDPPGNHTAIMANGSITHTATNGNATTACSGTTQGCYWPGALDKFEESPSPSTHNQRIELHSGYSDSACTTTATGGAYTQIKAWTDCTSCSDTAADFPSTPTISRCISLDTSMNTVYFGFTGGFSSASVGQGVYIRNLDLRWQ